MVGIDGEELRVALKRMPRVNLDVSPTPLHLCSRLSREYCRGSRLWLKREDLVGFGMGGNKARMLELILGKACQEGADAIINTEFAHSNLDRLLAAAAARLGIEFHFLAREDPVKGQAIQGNLLLAMLAGAKVHFVNGRRHAETAEGLVTRIMEELKREGRRAYVMGREDRVLGTIAFLECAIEISSQCRRLGTRPDLISLSGHAATHAGLALGCKVLGEGTRVVAFRAFDSGQESVVNEVCDLANAAARRLGLSANLELGDVESVGDFGGRYREMTPSCQRAIETMARTEGIFLDPVYTGKAFAGFLEYLGKDRFAGLTELVFVHTGGTPNLFTYAEDLVRYGGYALR